MLRTLNFEFNIAKYGVLSHGQMATHVMSYILLIAIMQVIPE